MCQFRVVQNFNRTFDTEPINFVHLISRLSSDCTKSLQKNLIKIYNPASLIAGLPKPR